jgi:hypothetical protein
MTSAKKSTDKPVQPAVVAYKGFDKDWKCRDYQFEVGKTYAHKGPVKACESGFHSCEYPLDVFRYYEPASSVFALVEAGGDLSRHDEDSKIASSSLTVRASIDLPGIIKAAIEYTLNRTKPAKGASNSGYSGAASNSGDRGAASNSGYSGAASNSGDSGAASNSGDRGAASNSGVSGAASNSGVSGAASNSGYSGAASNSGNRGAASNSGDSGAASNSGYSGAASNSGYRGAASNSGNRGAASNSGDSGAASNSGDSGAASNSGYRGAASNSGYRGVAADFNGYYTKVKSCATGAIVCINRDNNGNILHIRASKVGENGIKPDTWYSLNDSGEFMEVV